MLLRLNAFGNHREPKFTSQQQHRLEYDRRLVVAGLGLDEAAVDLERVERHAAKIG